MYAQNEFMQSQQYFNVQQYTPNYSAYANNWCYPAQENWHLAVTDNRNDSAHAILKKRQESRDIIENFIDESKETFSKKEKAVKTSLKISEARDVVINVYMMQKKLEEMSEEMKNSKNMPDFEWEKKWDDCIKLRDEITKMMNTLENAVDLKKSIDKRRRKRCRDVRKKIQWKTHKALALERRTRCHAEADAWIREKQDIVEREKQVELLRKDADIVLADVRGKRSDARKFLGLLQELQNLRRVKVNIARARGENLPLAADQAFDNIIGQLLDQWTSLDREYSIEEQGLKLMLKTDNEQKIEKQKRSTFDDWESVLFGRKLQSFDPSRGDAHNLVMIRHAWDKYANNNGKGSRIPIGWLMPVVPSSAAWQKCLRRE